MVYVIVSHHSPSQNNFQFDDFLSGFENLSHDARILQPIFTVILGNFNTGSKSWWSCHPTTFEGARLNSLVSIHGIHGYTCAYIAKFFDLH